MYFYGTLRGKQVVNTVCLLLATSPHFPPGPLLPPVANEREVLNLWVEYNKSQVVELTEACFPPSDYEGRSYFSDCDEVSRSWFDDLPRSAEDGVAIHPGFGGWIGSECIPIILELLMEDDAIVEVSKFEDLSRDRCGVNQVMVIVEVGSLEAPPACFERVDEGVPFVVM